MSVGGADFNVQGRITIDLVARGLDAATRSLAGITAASEKAASSLKKVGDGFAAVGTKSRQIGQSLTLGVTTPLVGLGALAVNAASDLAEAASAVETVFGAAAKDVTAFADTSAKALGLSEQAALSAATQLGALFTGVGLGQSAAADFSNSILGASADLASFYNVAGGAEQVLQDIRSGLIGEAEPLRKYGILLSEAAVQQELAAQGQADLTGEQLEAAKVSARYAIIMRSMGAAQGDFARTSGGLANQMRIAKAEFTNAAAALGVQLIPIVLKAVRGLSRLIGVFTALPASVKTTILIVAGIAAVIGPALIALGVFASGLGVVATVLGVLLSPIGLLLLAIGALAVIFRGPLGQAVSFVIKVFKPFAQYLRDVFVAGEGVRKGLDKLPEPLRAIMLQVGYVVDGLGDLWRAFQAGGIQGFWDQLTIGGEGDQIKRGLRGIVGAFLDLAKNIPWSQIAADLGKRLGGAAIDAAGGLLDGLLGMVSSIDWAALGGALVDGVVDALGYLAANVPDAAKALLRLGDDLLDTIEGLDWNRVGQTLGTGLGRAVTWAVEGIADILRDPKPFLTLLAAVGLAAPVILARIYLAFFRIGRDILIGIVQGLYGQLPALWAAIQALGPAIVVAFGLAREWLTGPGRELVAGLLAGAIAKLPDLLAWLGGLLDAILPYVEDAWNWLFNAGYEVLAGFLAGAVDAARSLWTWLSGLPGVIAGYAGQAFNWLFNAGYNLMSGLASGIYAGFRDIVAGALSWVAEAIPDYIAGPLGIRSPSTVFMRLGQDTAAGFGIGFRDEWRRIEGAISAGAQSLALTAAAPPAPRLAPIAAGARTVQAGGISITVNGAGDPQAVADRVYRSLDAAFHRLELEVRR